MNVQLTHRQNCSRDVNTGRIESPDVSLPADERPLVLTLQLDGDAQGRFDRERAALFPAGRTQVGAHLTLFHALPAGLRDEAVAILEEAARREPLPLVVTGLLHLGRGVAYALQSSELLTLHAAWQARWWDHLSRQDRQPLRPHVTVQNKVPPEMARGTLARLRADFVPFEVTGEALLLWRYDGGPWAHERRFDFG